MKQLILIPILTFTLLGAASATERSYELAAAGCSQAAAEAAANTGGQVISAREQGGLCVVTVLVPGAPGQPPKRVVMTLPAS